jgi:hypothetical protein
MIDPLWDWHVWFLCGFASVGMFMTALLVWSIVFHWYEVWREQRRLDRMAHELVRYPVCALANLSPADITEARERWPVDAAFTTILARGEAELRTRSSEAMADAVFAGYRAQAPRPDVPMNEADCRP